MGSSACEAAAQLALHCAPRCRAVRGRRRLVQGGGSGAGHRRPTLPLLSLLLPGCQLLLGKAELEWPVRGELEALQACQRRHRLRLAVKLNKGDARPLWHQPHLRAWGGTS